MREQALVDRQRRVDHAPLVKRGTYVEAGQKVGYVTDFFGKTISEKRAPAAGVVLYVCGVPSMKKGDLMANIGQVGKPE